jgi:D-alanyl-lipoteichoic acid acyltransferase DltB (MBOAT superfamily)
LLLASYVFYAAWDWRFLGLILFSSLVDFVVGGQLGRSSDPAPRRLLLLTSLVINLGVLGFFKYFGFFIDSFQGLLARFGYTSPDWTLHIILPVGISFYTFQSLSYTIDIYRRELEPVRSPVHFLLFVGFFPQLVAGPIERARNLLPQIGRPRTFRPESVTDGLRLVLWGLFKKVVVADSAGWAVQQIIPFPDQYPGSVLALGLGLAAFQLYFDFSGYSDIAVGLARMLGFELMRNFRLPLLASSFPDFWRRWHISLTTWFRDYVFQPLLGPRSRYSRARAATALMVTFLLTGLWHGAAWGFVVWGGLHGLLYLVFRPIERSVRGRSGAFSHRKTLLVGMVVLTFVINVGVLVFFVIPDIPEALHYLSQMLKGSLFAWPTGYKYVFLAALSVALLEWFQERRDKDHALQIDDLPILARWGLYYAMAALILYFNHDRLAFVYFQF